MCGCMSIPCYALTLCCQDVSSFVSYLPRCPIFSAGGVVCVHVCVCVNSVLSRCLIFCQIPARFHHFSAGGVVYVHVYYVCVYVLTLCCQDVSSFVSYLPRCPIFRQAELCACMCIMCVYALTLCCHLLSATCQDAPIFRQAELCACMCVYVLTLCCQDVSSFVRYLPGSTIFRQAELCVCMC